METLTKIDNLEQNQEDKYIISVKLLDWSVIYPAYISENDINFKEELRNATNLFRSRYRNNWIVETIIDKNILNSQDIKPWSLYKKEILENENNNQVWKLLKELNNLWVWSWLIDLIRKDLQVEDNIKLLKTYLDLAPYSEEDKKQIILAMQIAIEAHKWQVQKRKKDKEWLDSIPYSNHPIQVALFALKDLKMSAEEVQAALLHDVIEDTEIKLNWTTLKIWKIEWTFSKNTINMVLDCSRENWETREDFMQKMKLLSWNSKVIKCLDRLHNMIRAFSIKDSKYIKRYLDETIEVYLPAFEKMEELKPLKTLFYDVLEELESYQKRLFLA